MLSKNDIKLIRSLSQRKFRNKHGYFTAEGGKIINEFHKEGLEFERLFCLEGVLFPTELNAEIVKPKELSQISQFTSANDSLAIVKIPTQLKLDFKAISKQLILACDRIQDPGNMGTIIRIADWFGIKNIICSPDTVDVYSHKVVQSTMGSLARVKVHSQELLPIIDQIKSEFTDYSIMTSSLDGTDLYQKTLPTSGMLVLGNESIGASKEIQEKSSLLLKIPSYGKAESLNVAVSTGIILSEFKRRTNLQK